MSAQYVLPVLLYSIMIEPRAAVAPRKKVHPTAPSPSPNQKRQKKSANIARKAWLQSFHSPERACSCPAMLIIRRPKLKTLTLLNYFYYHIKAGSWREKN